MSRRLFLPGLALAMAAGALSTPPPSPRAPSSPGVRNAPAAPASSDRATPSSADRPVTATRPETKRKNRSGGRRRGYDYGTWSRWLTMPWTNPDGLTAKQKRARRSRRAQGLR